MERGGDEKNEKPESQWFVNCQRTSDKLWDLRKAARHPGRQRPSPLRRKFHNIFLTRAAWSCTPGQTGKQQGLSLFCAPVFFSQPLNAPLNLMRHTGLDTKFAACSSLIPLIRPGARLHQSDGQYCKGADQQPNDKPQDNMPVFSFSQRGCCKAENGP